MEESGALSLLQAGLAEQAVAGRTALCLPPDLSIENWSRIGSELVTVSDASAWWIGDWLVFGEERYGDRYRRAMADTSLNYQTLRNYAWVARRFEPSRRREKLTFQHHVEVAARSVEEQDHWLDLAVKLSWSRNQLRRELRNSESADDELVRFSQVELQLRVDKERMDQWEEAAKQCRASLIDWIAATLDGASRDRYRHPEWYAALPSAGLVAAIDGHVAAER